MDKKVRNHLFISFWPMPYSWCKPKAKRYKSGDMVLCFGFGQIEIIKDY